MITKWIYLAGFLLFVLACNTDTKHCFKFVESASLIIKLNDESGNNLIAAWGTRYDSDSVKLLYEDEELYTTAIGSGDISFPIVSTSDQPVKKLLSNTYYLQLPPWPGNPNVDVDTIHYKYILEENDCPDKWIQWIKVSYNDSTYHEGDYTNEMNLNFVKK